MNDINLIKELRALTSAGMKDCKDALEEASWDLQKAVDLVKIKGLNIADGRTGIVAADGLVSIVTNPTADKEAIMVEVNCQTDFVANSNDFKFLVEKTMDSLCMNQDNFQISDVEPIRLGIVALTKENIVVRRWKIEKSKDPTERVFSYKHSNNKIGVIITMKAANEAAANSYYFRQLGEDLAMQIAAMSPLAVDSESIPLNEKDRQKSIFETQLKEEKRPEKMWDKILEGKFRKWNTEVCLLEQESVVIPKTSVKQVIKNVGTQLGGEIQVLSFTRFQVGEGIEKKADNLAEEVAKMMTPVEHGVLR